MQAHTPLFGGAGLQKEEDQLCIEQNKTSEFLRFSESAPNELVRSHMTKAAVLEGNALAGVVAKVLVVGSFFNKETIFLSLDPLWLRPCLTCLTLDHSLDPQRGLAQLDSTT